MCFFSRRNSKLLVSRSFHFLNGVYSININKKKIDRKMVVDIRTNEGTIDLILVNITDNKEILHEAVETGIYEFNIIKNNKYRFMIHSHNASGAYSVCLMSKL